MIASAEGLSTQSRPIVNLSSPVRHIANFLQSESALAVSAPVTATIQEQESSTGSPNEHESVSISTPNSLLAKVQQTRSAGLFNGTPVASTSLISPIKLTKPITRTMYMTGSDSGTHGIVEGQLQNWQGMDQNEWAKEILRMRQENQKPQKTIVGLTAKLSLMSLENTDIHHGLNSKVLKQPTV